MLRRVRHRVHDGRRKKYVCMYVCIHLFSYRLSGIPDCPWNPYIAKDDGELAVLLPLLLGMLETELRAPCKLDQYFTDGAAFQSQEGLWDGISLTTKASSLKLSEMVLVSIKAAPKSSSVCHGGCVHVSWRSLSAHRDFCQSGLHPLHAISQLLSLHLFLLEIIFCLSCSWPVSSSEHALCELLWLTT